MKFFFFETSTDGFAPPVYSLEIELMVHFTRVHIAWELDFTGRQHITSFGLSHQRLCTKYSLRALAALLSW